MRIKKLEVNQNKLAELLPVIKMSKDNACVDNIFPLGGCDIAELASKASILLQRACKLNVLLTLAAQNLVKCIRFKKFKSNVIKVQKCIPMSTNTTLINYNNVIRNKSQN